LISALFFRHPQHQAVECVADLDLARQAAGLVDVVGVVEHGDFGRRARTGPLEPGGVDMDVAGGARTGAAAFGDDARDIVADRAFHRRLAGLDLDGMRLAGVFDIGDFGHQTVSSRAPAAISFMDIRVSTSWAGSTVLRLPINWRPAMN